MTDNLELDSAERAIGLAAAKLSDGQAEVTLDFSSVRRIDSKAAEALEQLAAAAREKSARLTLRGVNGDVYKVLKLLRLSGGFAFLN